jgi:hypothetical protein
MMRIFRYLVLFLPGIQNGGMEVVKKAGFAPFCINGKWIEKIEAKI